MPEVFKQINFFFIRTDQISTVGFYFLNEKNKCVSKYNFSRIIRSQTAMMNLIVYMEDLTLLAPRSPTSPIIIEPFLMSHFTVETNMTINMQKINLLKTAGMAITNTARMNLRGFMTYYYSLIEHAIDGNLVLLRWSLAIYEIICVNPFPV